jgi:hypothetical protein
MKNPLIIIGILLYMSATFLPWGPEGTNLETGFNEEASPGLLGMIVMLVMLLFSFKSSKKSYFIVIFISVMAFLLPLTVLSKIMDSPAGIGGVQYGVYLMLISTLLSAIGAVAGLKRLKNLSAGE